MTQFCIANSYNTALSDDGLNWTLGGAPTISSSVKRVLWGDGKWCILLGSSDFGRVNSSVDAAVWTEANIASNAMAFTYTGTIFCVVKYANYLTSMPAYLSTDLVSWTPAASTPLFTTAPCRAIAWNGSGFCVLTGSSNTFTSANGMDWVENTGVLLAANLSIIASNESVFCIISLYDVDYNPTNIAATSTDGITWVSRTLPALAYWTDLIWAETQFVAIAATGEVAYSTDGITWSLESLPTLVNGDSWEKLAYSGGVLCAITGLVSSIDNSYASNVAVSADGISWVPGVLPPDIGWQAIGGKTGVGAPPALPMPFWKDLVGTRSIF